MVTLLELSNRYLNMYNVANANYNGIFNDPQHGWVKGIMETVNDMRIKLNL